MAQYVKNVSETKDRRRVMVVKSERDTLAAQYENMAANGLVDVKFFLRNQAEASAEQVCREVNAIYAALERNEFKPLVFGDRTRA
jgi:hypothetical protein